MFDRLAGRYNLFNSLISLGLDSLWRNEALKPVLPGMNVLDLGCGTGDLSVGAARRLKGQGQVTGLDFSQRMLEVARQRLERLPPTYAAAVRLVRRSAQELPFEEAPYDLVLSGFVLRNLYESIEWVLSGVYRSLKKDGAISFLDFTQPPNPVAWRLWRLYMNSFVALYGRALFGKDYPESYLTQSAERFLKKDEFVKRLEAQGFVNIRVKSDLFGIIVLYQATKS